jgi:hypothetical protein
MSLRSFRFCAVRFNCSFCMCVRGKRGCCALLRECCAQERAVGRCKAFPFCVRLRVCTAACVHAARVKDVLEGKKRATWATCDMF